MLVSLMLFNARVNFVKIMFFLALLFWTIFLWYQLGVGKESFFCFQICDSSIMLNKLSSRCNVLVTVLKSKTDDGKTLSQL